MALTDKVALVTGASRGIGAAIADLLGTEGATVIGTATSEEGAAKITARLKEKGIKGKGMALNVADPESIASVVAAINEEYGAPAILVNNAGITKDNLLMRMKDDEWFDVIDTNLNAIYRLSKACLRGMSKARWGRIINIGSNLGQYGENGKDDSPNDKELSILHSSEFLTENVALFDENEYAEIQKLIEEGKHLTANSRIYEKLERQKPP